MPRQNSKKQEADSQKPEKNEVQGKSLKKPLFEYPALPKLEMATYFLVLVTGLAYAWSRIYKASRAYSWDSDHGWGRFEDGHWPLDLGTYRKDTSNFEWRLWTIVTKRYLPWFFGHSILFNFGHLLLPQEFHKIFILLYWLTAHYSVAGTTIVLITLAQGVTVFFIASLTGSKVLTWLTGIYLLYMNINNPFMLLDDPEGVGFYLSITTFSYKMLHYLSYSTEMMNETEHISSKKPNGKPRTAVEIMVTFFKKLLDMFFYAFYLPYSYNLIVIYKRFPKQLTERVARKRDLQYTLFFGLRIVFWYLVCEIGLRFLYFEALMDDPEYLQQTAEDTLVSVGYALGQFFHLKYVVIFGLPAFFARLDNMQPLEGPICITRVALYSKMWRYFDRGLYDFFKEYIFLPICRPTFSVTRKLVAMCVCYGFVLVWHGTTHKYVVWIVLNVSEILIESISKGVYSIPVVREFREKRISDRNFRRILAWLQIVPFSFGLYSNFYFLGSAQSGYVFVERIFWQETVKVQWPFLVLVGIGYCYSHVCMEVDRLQSEDGKRPATSESKKSE